MDDRQALLARFASMGSVPRPPPLPNETGLHLVADTLAEPMSAPVMRPGFDRVTLKIRRDQAKAMIGGVGFSVHVIAELSPEALQAVRHYRLGSAVLYQKDLDLKLSSNVFVALWRVLILRLTRKQWRITVDDLVQGRQLAAKDVIDMLGIETDVRQAAETFAAVLRAAAYFGGEELVEL